MFTINLNPTPSLESALYFEISPSMIAIEGMDGSRIKNALSSMVSAIANVITRIIKWTKDAKTWFRNKIISLAKLPYVDMPAGQYRQFKIASNALMDLLRFVTFVVPKLVSSKAALVGKIGKAIHSKAGTHIPLNMAGQALSQATVIADTIDKISNDITTYNLTLKLTAFDNFKSYTPVPGERMIRVSSTELKWAKLVQSHVLEISEAITDSLTEIKETISSFVKELQKNDNGEGYLDDEEVASLTSSLTRLPSLFGATSNMMVVLSTNSMIMINMMLGMMNPASQSTGVAVSGNSAVARA